MNNIKNINWTNEVFEAYVLIFSISANKTEKPEELKILNNMFDSKTIEKAHKEFNNDTFNESIQKIEEAVIELKYTKNKIQSLFNNIKRVFDADGEFSIRERNLTLSLKRALGF